MLSVYSRHYPPCLSADIIRLIGRVESGVLEDLKTQIEGHGSKIRLDLEEVTLV